LQRRRIFLAKIDKRVRLSTSLISHWNINFRQGSYDQELPIGDYELQEHGLLKNKMNKRRQNKESVFALTAKSGKKFRLVEN
jgi:hypothetical protein